MARVEGCWANVLDNCEGPVTGEHLISMAVWEPPPGALDNREAKESLSIRMVYGPDHPLAGEHTVLLKDLVAPTLCRHHNHSSHRVDLEAKKFREALLEWKQTLNSRGSGGAGVRRTWPAHRVTVDGPTLERWFYKTAINIACWQQRLPVGASDAQPAQPTADLANRVFTANVPARRPMGLAYVGQVGDQHDFGENFEILFYDRNSTHIAGCLLTFRGMGFVVKLEDHDVPEWIFQRAVGKSQAVVIQPLRRINSDVNCEVYVNWSKEPKRKRTGR